MKLPQRADQFIGVLRLNADPAIRLLDDRLALPFHPEDQGPLHRHGLEDLGGDHRLEEVRLLQEDQVDVRRRDDPGHPRLLLLREHDDVLQPQGLHRLYQCVPLGAIPHEEKHELRAILHLFRRPEHRVQRMGHPVRSHVGGHELSVQAQLLPEPVLFREGGVPLQVRSVRDHGDPLGWDPSLDDVGLERIGHGDDPGRLPVHERFQPFQQIDDLPVGDRPDRDDRLGPQVPDFQDPWFPFQP